MTISVGDRIPYFNLKAVDGKPFDKLDMDNVFININEKSYTGKWVVLFFYPKDFTFVCPTEIETFADLNEEFKSRNAQVLSCSIDGEFVHYAWRKHQKELKDLPFPMLSDVKRELSDALGIIDINEGVSQRATFVFDPEGVLRFSMVTDLNVGRNPQEVLRILDALQTGELCPCNWHRGDSTINVNQPTKTFN